jgi:hypothetical protein
MSMMAKSTKALLTGRIQMCKTNPSIAHIGLATHGRSIQIGSSQRSGHLVTVDLTRNEIWFLKALRAAGERGRIVSAPASRAGLAHLVEVQYVTEHPQSERKTLYITCATISECRRPLGSGTDILRRGARAIANLKLARAEHHLPPCECRHWRRGRL